MQKTHLHHSSKRVLCALLALLMILSTLLSGCSSGITTHALEDEHVHDEPVIVSDDTVSTREILADTIDPGLAQQAAEIGDTYWEKDVPATEEDVLNEYYNNEDVLDVPEIEIGSSVDLDKIEAPVIEKKFDENGLRETEYMIKVMYTTVDANDLEASGLTEMFRDNRVAYITNENIIQHLYEVEGLDNAYVAFVNQSALNGLDGELVAASFTRGSAANPIDMSDQVVLDKEKGVLYVPKAWCFAGDGAQVGLDLTAQVMIAVDTQDEEKTDEYGNLLANVSVTVENNANANIVLRNGQYSMVAYDFVILPLFEAGSVSTLDTDEIDVYVNGSAEPVNADALTYCEATGELSIKQLAASVADVKVVMKKRTLIQAVAGAFSIGRTHAVNVTADHPGMTPILNVDTGEPLRPNIDVTSLTVNDVFIYETIGSMSQPDPPEGQSSEWGDMAQAMWSGAGANQFVYTSAGGSANLTDLHWMFVGNKDVNIEHLDYGRYGVAGGMPGWFVIELPIASAEKDVPNPVLLRTQGNKIAPGTQVAFGSEEDWAWTSRPDQAMSRNGKYLKMSRCIYGQCTHTEGYSYMSGNQSFENAEAPADGLKKPYKAGITEQTVIGGKTWYPAAMANGWYKASENGEPVFYETEFWQWGNVVTGEETSADPGFKCYCDCAECVNYRKTHKILNEAGTAFVEPDFCDSNCPRCSSGDCEDCSMDWLNSVDHINAQAVFRILAMGEDYIVLGFTQLDTGDIQHGSAILKVMTSVKVSVLKKASSTLNGGTADNNCYAPLTDSVYGIYLDAACTQLKGTVTGDGVSYVQVPPNKEYYIKEIRAPKGYYLDPEAHPVTPVKNTVYEFADVPMDDPVMISVQKDITDRGTAGVTGGDVGKLSGIQFEVSYYKGVYTTLESLPATPTESALFQTDEFGFLLLDDSYLVPGQTWMYRGDTTGELMFPLGTVKVQEKSSIAGLLINNPTGVLFTVTDESDKTDPTVQQGVTTGPNGEVIPGYHGTLVTRVGSSNKTPTADRVGGTYENYVVKGGVTVRKADRDWEVSDYQGDATLAGAEFTIYNRSDDPVYYKGNFYDPDAAIDVITTAYDPDADAYVASTGNYALEYGTYEIKETKAPTGYNLADWSRTFEIREDGQMHEYVRTNAADIVTGLNWVHRWCVDAVMRGGVAFGKVDREIRQYYSLGAASLVGAKFELYNRSEHPVYVKGTTYAVGEKIMDFVSREMNITIETGIEGYTKDIVGNTTGNYVLPYGTYEIVETGTGIGYLYDSNSKAQVKRFSIRGEGEMHYFTDEADAFHNQVQREDWYFSKKADDSGHEMVKTAWTVTSVTTGETHIIVTDENGKYQSDQVDHSQRTNANDPDSPISNGAVKFDENGNYYVADASKLDYDAGTWFTGVRPELVTWNSDGLSYNVDLGVEDSYGNAYVSTGYVNDDLRAYPYDTYLVQELPSEANEGYNLVNFIVTLKRFNDDPDSNGILLDYGTVDDQRVDIYTQLGYTPTKFSNVVKFVPADPAAEIVDTITYSGLTEGDEYVMKGELHALDKDGNDTGVVATNEMTFTAKAAGQLKMPFVVDTTKYYDYVLVATEAIYQNGTLLTEETDLSNIDQSVIVQESVSIFTELFYMPGEFDNPVKYVPAETNVKLNDTITYYGLIEGDEYTVKGEIHALDASGNDAGVIATNEITFKADALGQLKMVFDVDTTKYYGQTLVATEAIYRNGVLVGQEADLKNVDQSVVVWDTDVFIDTYAVNAETNGKELAAQPAQSIYECIKLSGMHREKQYKLVGELFYINEYGHPTAVLDANGDPITMTIENPERTETMTFVDIDATDLEGRSIVVYQTLYERANENAEWRVFATHCNERDEDQMVHIPMIDTEFLSAEGIHNAQAEEGITITDRVDYTNLVPGQKYTLTGILHFREDTEVEGGYEAVDMGEAEGVVGVLEFVPEHKDGSVDLAFTYVDARKFDGKVVVAIEELHTSGTANVPEKWAEFFTKTGDTSSRLVTRHAEIGDLDQTLGFGRIKATTLTTSDGTHQAGAAGNLVFTDVIDYEGLVPGQTYTITGVLNRKDGADLSELEQLLTNIPAVVNEATIGQWFADVRDWAETNKADEIFTLASSAVTAAENEDAEEVVKDRAMLIDMLNAWNEAHNSGRTILFVVEKTFVPETQNGSISVEFPFNADGLDGQTVVATETITCNGVFVAEHDDMEDEMQSVHFTGIDTVLSGTAKNDASTGSESGSDEGSGDDENASGGTPGSETSSDADYSKVDSLIFDGQKLTANDAKLGSWFNTVKIWATKMDESKIALEASYGIDACESNSYENMLKYRISVLDMLNSLSDEIVTIPETPIKTVKFKVYFGSQLIYGVSQLQVEAFKLVDTVKLTNLTPGTEYTLVSEAHLRTQVGNAKVDMGNMNFNETTTFTASETEETIKVIFNITPFGIQEADIVAYEYLYQGDALVGVHADITDDDQAVHVVAEPQKDPMDGDKPEKNPCGCEDPKCAHKDEKDHCVNNSGCCNDSDCCNTCDTCKGKNPCGCTDPDCKHKDEKDHCKKPGCCDDSDCCKDCTECKPGNACGCDDPDCKHKDEKDHCKKPGCCDDSDCCKGCDDCKPGNACGCDDPTCKHKDEKDHCKKPGCCDDSDCCKGCDDCKPGNACGCDDPNCKHKDEKDHCKKPGCCDDSDCCKDCDGCQPKNPCGCSDPKCEHKDEKDHCKNNPGCCDNATCCNKCEECKPKNLCGCSDLNCKHKNEKDHCVNNPGCCSDSNCCKDCKDCKAKNPCGCADPDCKHKNEKDHCVNNPGCCSDSNCCKDCKDCAKNPCGCTDPKCKHKNEKNHCVNNPGCCADANCCKDCEDCKVKNPCGCADPNCKHKNEKNHCVNNPGCCDGAGCCKNCSECKPKNPVQQVVENIKTGENAFLLLSLLGLAMLAGGGYFFFGKTEKGRDVFKKIREKLSELFGK